MSKEAGSEFVVGCANRSTTQRIPSCIGEFLQPLTAPGRALVLNFEDGRMRRIAPVRATP